MTLSREIAALEAVRVALDLRRDARGSALARALVAHLRKNGRAK